ncbi:MAG TPA: hypothetical protein VG055_25620 [Planctomycetaceae bacterium]|jgi:hypothetical protein|nr:hypothetical protein [Planctomycetaceae bacterium]
MTTTAVLEMRRQAAQQAESLGILDAVRTIAKSGGTHAKTQWVKDWEGKRYLYGERMGDSDRPYAEVCVLQYAQQANPDLVTGTVLIYSLNDRGETECFRQGPWVAATVTEAERIKALPPAAKVADPADANKFAPYNG